MHVFGDGCAFVGDVFLQMYEVLLDCFPLCDIFLEALDDNFAEFEI